MKVKLLKALTGIVLLLMPGINYAQSITLGTAANYELFTSVGAVTNSSPSQLTGDIGTNSGSSTGFGNVNGVMENNNLATAQCGSDLLIAYGQLNTAIPTFFPSPLLGNGDTLLPGVYNIPSAATLSLNLVLNAQGNPNAVFIFQIGGAFAVGAAANVKLINSGLACNVYWKAEGLVTIAAGVTMRGTIIANNAAITMGTNDTLEGRAMSTNGAVAVGGLMGYTPIGCGSVLLTGPGSPALASTANYGIFSSNGPVTNTGITHVIGDVGSNVGLTTGFNPLFVTGTIHYVPDASTATCATDLANVYTYLSGLPYDIELLYPAQFGNGLVLTPHTYLMNAATTFTGTVYLNAEGDADAIFVIQINGAMATSTFANVQLINGTQPGNVYWAVNGAVNVNDNSHFTGTIIANNGAVTFSTGDTLTGRAFSTDGAVTIGGTYVNATELPGAGGISGPSVVCVGSSVPFTDTTAGGVWSSSNADATVTTGGIVTGITAGIDTIFYTTTGTSGTTASKMITISPAPNAGTISGPSGVCVGSTIILTDPAIGGAWSSSNATATVTGGIVTGVAPGIDTIRYAVTNSCGTATAIKQILVSLTASAGTITGPSNVCIGTPATYTDAVFGGVWTLTNTKATVTPAGGIVNGLVQGTDTLVYNVNNGCGAAVTSKVITITPAPNAGTISGPSNVCTGSQILLTDPATGGSWSSSNATATTTGGLVTGVSQGADTISYTFTNSCGTARANKNIFISDSAVAGTITGPSNICVGIPVAFTDNDTGGIWSSSNTNAVFTPGDSAVIGVTPGFDTLSYTVTNGCSMAVATKAITVTAIPDAGLISGPSAVCTGSVISLTDNITGGSWSSSNSSATVTGGMVTGAAPGIDTIHYSFTNACGTDVASKDITVNAVPALASITTFPVSPLCDGAMYQNFGTVSAPDAPVVYNWTATKATVWAQGTAHQYSLVNFDTSGTAFVTLTSSITATGCTSTSTVAITVNTTVADDPQVIYSESNLICLEDNATSYQWGYDDYLSLDSTVLVGEVNQNYSIPVLDSTKFYWVMSVRNGCMQKTYYIAPAAGDHRTTAPYGTITAATAAATEVKIFPNPATETITVAVTTPITGDIQVQVLNLLGQQLITAQTINNKANINVAGLPAGTYLIDCYLGGLKISAARFTKN